MKSRNTRLVISNKFLSSWGYALHFCWSNLMITGNFSNSAAQFLLVGACGYAHSIPCFQDDLSVFKAFTSKVFKCPNKKVFFEWQVYLLNSFVPFQKQIKQPCHIELHLTCGRVSGFTPVFFYYGSKTWWMFGDMSPWAVVTQCQFFGKASSRSFAGRVTKLSCVTRINIILSNLPHLW